MFLQIANCQSKQHKCLTKCHWTRYIALILSCKSGTSQYDIKQIPLRSLQIACTFRHTIWSLRRMHTHTHTHNTHIGSNLMQIHFIRQQHLSLTKFEPFYFENWWYLLGHGWAVLSVSKEHYPVWLFISRLNVVMCVIHMLIQLTTLYVPYPEYKQY